MNKLVHGTLAGQQGESGNFLHFFFCEWGQRFSWLSKFSTFVADVRLMAIGRASSSV
jgi:hypothetical protein